jgi:4-diphosphocytidyl-2-C-methyl-D-erythritol kinase
VTPRTARVRAHAKINLSLKVLGRREDGYHEIRTVFQTIGLHDILEFRFTPGRGLALTLDDPLRLPDNLVLRAARAFCERFGVRGALEMKLAKRIPAGGGLGGGSSDAAAVLLALPALTGAQPSLAALLEIAAGLGSDVPFFLFGGTALGLGRGEELYPLPEFPPLPVLVLAPPLHVSTPEAYRALNRPALTSSGTSPKLNNLRSFVWSPGDWASAENDFEAAVFELHPELKRWQRKLERSGAHAARLSGSGAALFGVFPNQATLQGALPRFRTEPLQVFSSTLVSRARYRAGWIRALRDHVAAPAMKEVEWPPRTRHTKHDRSA